jgi:hypothetical protein
MKNKLDPAIQGAIIQAAATLAVHRQPIEITEAIKTQTILGFSREQVEHSDEYRRLTSREGLFETFNGLIHELATRFESGDFKLPGHG